MRDSPQNGRSEPASFLQGARDPSQDAKGLRLAPNFGQFAVPHLLTFQGLAGSFAKAYRATDEAIKHSLDNARFMRNDCTLMECLESRQRCTSLLGWHLEPEDESSADQRELCAELTKILSRIRRFTEYRRCLLEAIWYGKAGVQHRYGWTTIGNRRRVMPMPESLDEHPGWVPINGDKIVFRYNDGSFDPNRGTIGLLSGALGAHRDFGGPRVKWDVEPTAQGLAAFIPPSLRSIVAIHKHMIEDGAWEDPENAGSIHGVGVRSRIYWAWFQKQEALAFLMEYLERSAGGIEVWEYPAHNPEAKAKTEQAARERLANGRNVVLFPRDESAAGVPYELRFVEPGMAGIETLKDLLERYFGHMVKRYILGQTLSSEAEATGLGSGVAELHFDTLMQIVRYDATNLEETITHELLTPIKDFNFPAAKRHHVRFVIETESPDAKAKLEAWERAYGMGARLDERAVMDLIGAAMPQAGDRVLQRPDMGQQPGAGPAGGDGPSGGPGGSGGPESPRGRSQASVPASLVDDAAEMGEALRAVDIDAAERYAKAFDESKHPRDDDGEFAEKKGGDRQRGADGSSAAVVYRAVAARYGIPPEVVANVLSTSPAELKRRDEYVPPNNTSTPTIDHEKHPLHAVKMASWSEPMNAPLSWRVDMDPHELEPTEPDDGITKTKTFEDYVRWFREGIVPPPVEVGHTDDRSKVLSSNRRRVLAARAAGVTSIPTWFDTVNPETGNRLKYGDILKAAEELGYKAERYAKAFDEAEHPRDADGKFTDGGGEPFTLSRSPKKTQRKAEFQSQGGKQQPLFIGKDDVPGQGYLFGNVTSTREKTGERGEDEDRRQPQPGDMKGTERGVDEWESGKSLFESEKVDRETERILGEWFDNPEDTSTKELHRIRVVFGAQLASTRRKRERGELDAQQFRARTEGDKHELDLVDTELKLREKAGDDGPEHRSRAEKIAERAVFDGENVHAVAKAMGLTRYEFDDISDEIEVASAELRDMLGVLGAERYAKPTAGSRSFAWNEEDHPRDASGQFTDGGGTVQSGPDSLRGATLGGGDGAGTAKKAVRMTLMI